MLLKVKYIDIETPDINQVFLNPSLAEDLGLHIGERICLVDPKTNLPLFFGIVSFSSSLDKNSIGLQSKIRSFIRNIPESVKVEIRSLGSVSIIEKRLKGSRLSYLEFLIVFKDILRKWLSSRDISYFISTFNLLPYDEKETYDLVRAMINTGSKLEWDEDEIVVDKHSIGGIPNNRVSMILVPIVSSLGYKFPKLSSRAITSPSGTADTMEVFTNVNLTIDQIRDVVVKVNGCLAWGGSSNIAPVDDVLIQHRRDYRLDPLPLVLSSILSKKLAVGSKYIVLDIPYGPTAKVKSVDQVEDFVKHFVSIAERFGVKVKPIAMPTFGPIGRGVGPVLEARDVLLILKRKEDRPLDLEQKSVRFAVELLSMVEKDENKNNLKDKVMDILDSKKAYKQFERIVVAQGGSEENLNINRLKPKEDFVMEIKADRGGKIVEVNNYLVSKFARIAGCPFVKDVGVYLNKTVGDNIEKGEAVLTIYAESEIIEGVIHNELKRGWLIRVK